MKKNIFIRCILVFVILCLCFSNAVFAENENATITVNQEETTSQPHIEETVSQDNSDEQNKPNNTNQTTRSSSKKSSNSYLKSISVLGIKDNGEKVSLSLTPEFSSRSFSYNITVPFEVVSLEISAQAEDSKSTVSIPQGYLNLDVGNNVSYINIKAENGSTRRYDIKTLRNEEVITQTEITTVPITQQVTLQAETTTEIDKAVLNEVKDVKMNRNTKLSIVFGVGAVIMIALSVIAFIKNRDYSEGD